MDKIPLENSFKDLRTYLDAMDVAREKILPLQRQTVRICSEIIKHVHREENEKIPNKILNAQQNLQEMVSILDQSPGSFPKDYLHIVTQELGEAIIFYNIIVKNKYPTPEECHIDSLDYAYALTDVIGELRRYTLTSIRKEELNNAETALSYMDEIYSHLFTLDYPNGLIPGLRNKIDQARNILAKTEGDVTVSINILKLNSNLDKMQLK